MKGRKSIAFIIMLLIAGLLSSCRMDLFDSLKTGGGATVAPRDGQWIASTGVNAEIVITFDSSMNGSTPPLSGDLGPVSTAVWTTANILTITPVGWTPDATSPKTLTVTCSTTDGVSMTLDYSFMIAGSVRYVSASGTAATPDGSRTAPYTEIQTAIDEIGNTGVPYPGVVLVAAGTYDSVCPVIDLNKNVSLYGGWATDWSERNPGSNVSLISPSATDGSAAILIQSENVLASTVVDGFTVSMTEPAASTTWNGILIDKGHVTLRNMIINSGEITDKSGITLNGIQVLSGSTATISDCTISLGAVKRNVITSVSNTNTGIYVNASTPDISNVTVTTAGSVDMITAESKGICYESSSGGKISNSTISLGSQIYATTTASGCKNYGMYITDSSPEINNMNIHAGEVIMQDNTSGLAYGIYISNGSPTIHDNPQIHGGRASQETYSIFLANSSSSEIKTNTIFGGKDSPKSYGIYINGVGCNPTILENTIDGGDNQPVGGSATGIFASTNSSPTIEYNDISVSSGVSAWGIEVLSNAFPVITRNLINPGSNASLSYGIGIENIGSNLAEVHNNVILGGGGSSNSYGIYIVDSTSNIYNNTVNGGSGGTAYAIWLGMTTTPYSVNLINNNLFNDNTTPSGYAIYESNINSYPNNVTNNNIFNVAVLYYDFDTVSSSITDISTLEATFTPYTGNISQNIYSDLDKIYYRYTGDIGLWTFDTDGLVSITTIDRDGLSRTDPCSIGAHEYD